MTSTVAPSAVTSASGGSRCSCQRRDSSRSRSAPRGRRRAAGRGSGDGRAATPASDMRHLHCRNERRNERRRERLSGYVKRQPSRSSSWAVPGQQARLAGPVARVLTLPDRRFYRLRQWRSVLATAACPIGEASAFGDEAEQAAGGAARPVHPGFPLRDRLLAHAQLLRQLALGEAEVAAQRLHAVRIPGRRRAAGAIGLPVRGHAGSVHETVYAVQRADAGAAAPARQTFRRNGAAGLASPSRLAYDLAVSTLLVRVLSCAAAKQRARYTIQAGGSHSWHPRSFLWQTGSSSRTFRRKRRWPVAW